MMPLSCWPKYPRRRLRTLGQNRPHQGKRPTPIGVGCVILTHRNGQRVGRVILMHHAGTNPA